MSEEVLSPSDLTSPPTSLNGRAIPEAEDARLRQFANAFIDMFADKIAAPPLSERVQ